MLKLRPVFGLALVMGLFATQAEAETESVSFTLVNRTSRNLEEFYASPPEAEDWEEDVLGGEVLAPGESITIVIDDGREDCQYDFMGVLGPDAEGTVGRGALIQSGVSVCNGDSYEYFEE
ncbi:MAG: hypothetical protein VKK42_01350 [Lyngbya sp.]|nr:hypothetical protein [Lyngbya sp.]